MILIVGGSCQGKLDYACDSLNLEKSQFTDGKNCSLEQLSKCRGIHHFHEYIRRMILKGEDTKPLAGYIHKVNPDIVIIADELGCGIVPTDKNERMYREAAGRSCCELAVLADEVHRVICGIGTVIKHV